MKAWEQLIRFFYDVAFIISALQPYYYVTIYMLGAVNFDVSSIKSMYE
jgi:hypothetical protein